MTYAAYLLNIMNKKEKYINYIVDDLINNTEINYEQEIIITPFSSQSSFDPFYIISPSPYYPYRHSLSIFSKYLKERYGVRDDESQIIWDQYKQIIKSLINNE